MQETFPITSTLSSFGKVNEMDSVLRRPPFVPFDRKQAVRIYLRNLPHWRQDGATYFLTFRLHDSLPAKALGAIKFEEEKWLAARGIESNPDRRKNLEKLSRQEGYLYRKHLNRLREQVHDKGYGACWLNQLPIIDVLREQILQDDGGGAAYWRLYNNAKPCSHACSPDRT